MILEALRKRRPFVKHLFADGVYDRNKLMDKAAFLDFTVEVIRRCDQQEGFSGFATTLGRRENIRMDDAMEKPSQQKPITPAELEV